MDVRTPPTLQGEFHPEEMSTLDTHHIVAVAARSGVLREIPAYSSRPFKIKKSKEARLDPRSEEAASKIQDLLGTREAVSEWEWSANKTGEQALSKLLRLAENTHVPAKLGAIEALLLLADYLISEPNINGKIVQEPPLELAGIEDTLIVRDSSSGADPPGNPGGDKKRQNAYWAVKSFAEKTMGAKGAPFVYEVQPKGNEILKKNKAQRKIFAQSTADMVTAQICTHALVYRPTSMCSKSASSLSMGGNTGYQMLRHLTPDIPWDDCGRNPSAHRDIVKEAWGIVSQPGALAEEDKTEWEYNLDIKLKVIFILATTIQVRWTGKEHYLLPFADSVASFLCPLIGLTGTLAIAAPHFMPSGHLWTLRGNTGGHKIILLSYKQLRLADREQDALLWFDSAILQGDDFLSRNVFGEDYSDFADKKWGCITKKSFGSAEEVRFLQRKLHMYEGQPRLSYDVARAKIKASFPRPELRDHAEALKQLALATGDDELREVLREVYLEMKVPRVSISGDGRCTDAAFFDKGVMATFWSGNDKLKKETGTYYALGFAYGMHPDYFDSVVRRARKM